MRLKKLTLFTKQLLKQFHFYNEILGFPIPSKGARYVEFLAGDSILRFEESTISTPYHFAFNVPSNQIHSSKDWLKKRTQIIVDDGVEVIPFDFWNAEAVYFYDADNNIVEFIARKNLKIESEEKFSPQSILNISEIGIPVNDIHPIFNRLNEELSLEMYSGNLERFSAIGDEEGLFIVINKKHKKTWFPTNDTPISSDFSAIIENRGKRYKIRFTHQNIYTHELKPNHHSFAEFGEIC